MSIAVVFVVLFGLASPAARQVSTEPTAESIAVVKVSAGMAVIRVGSGPLQKVKVGDTIGKTKATVKEIGGGRVVLEDAFTGADGRANRALVVIKEGQRGGTRYLQRPDEPAFAGQRPPVVVPVGPTQPPPTKP